MRKLAIILTLAAFLALAFSVTLLAVDADGIVSKYLKARGGVKKLEALKTVHMKGKIFAGSMTGDIEITNKTPNLHVLKIALPMITVTEGCDGKNVWSFNSMTGLKKYEGEELQKRLEQTRIEPLLGFKDRGGKYELLGIEPVKGDSCYKMLFIQGTGDTTYSYFDVNTYHMLKTEAISPEGRSEQYFEDYKDIDGYVFPFKMKTIAGPQRMIITFDEITVNKPVADSLFVMPDSASVPLPRMRPLPDSVRNMPIKQKDK